MKISYKELQENELKTLYAEVNSADYFNVKDSKDSIEDNLRKVVANSALYDIADLYFTTPVLETESNILCIKSIIDSVADEYKRYIKIIAIHEHRQIRRFISIAEVQILPLFYLYNTKGLNTIEEKLF